MTPFFDYFSEPRTLRQLTMRRISIEKEIKALKDELLLIEGGLTTLGQGVPYDEPFCLKIRLDADTHATAQG